MEKFSIRFYHVEQAKKYASFLAAHINKEITEKQFSDLIDAISILRTLTAELYETKTK